ncbi:hypothetical protein [Dyadobacter jejuensis]|uniref:hypothetical protein n=1 Tax=Dyadobacter jejuensis TaxID=1082580 RepID=UPI000D6D66BA|nr:hypothetical protein [Dyadobacter jejuensis]
MKVILWNQIKLKITLSLLSLLLIGGFIKAQLQQIATSNLVWNGVTTSTDGRIFVIFPKIKVRKGISVSQVLKDRSIIPYPTEDWNNWQPSVAINEKNCSDEFQKHRKWSAL